MRFSISSAHSLHPGAAAGDEDPRKSGILHSTRCRAYREQLQTSRQAHILQGLLIVTGLVTVLAVIWFKSLELMESKEGEEQEPASLLMSLWLSVSSFLGVGVLQQTESGASGSAHGHHCVQKLNTVRMFRQIGKQVLNQEQALARLQRVVQSERRFRSVALLGPPGVGKSLTAQALRQLFPWPENVHAYSWSTYVPDSVHKFQVMRNFVEQLSDCGQNLLIIDNLSTCDYTIVPIYNSLLLEREGLSGTAGNQTVLVVYIFNLQLEYYWEQFELLQQLPMETTIINYCSFGRDELLDCLENELRLEQRSLNQETISKILEDALKDVDSAGCKQLRRLIFEHGLSTLY